ncbi:MAG TPA: M48 family metallopeptidase [Thermodesulfovibrionales bacterium]|nr:M48 family metallopeptidase [Thermodesulfovibrionales bacterium]
MKKFGLTVPSVLEGKIDVDLLKKTQAYETEKTRFGFISSLFGNIVTIIFIFGGLLNIYNSWVVSLQVPFIVSGLLFFLILSYANTVISIPFSLYSTFKIENKYGFNTMTPKLWLKDFFKSIILSTIITGILVSVGLWIVQSSPGAWWIWIWGFFLVFSLFMMYISPYVIEPLFNKFTPLEEQVLVEQIKHMLHKVSITVSRVFRMDASKRSRHTNAYFSGIGRVKRIILYDTLLEIMNHDEILAVLAHEAGHWKRRHILKMIIATEFLSFFLLYGVSRIFQTDFLTDLFYVQNGTFFAKIVILGFLGGIVSLLFIPFSSSISRRFEREADRFAFSLSGNNKFMISALIKLSKDNLSNLHPHPLYAAFYYSHPPMVQRIEHIRNLKRDE